MFIEDSLENSLDDSLEIDAKYSRANQTKAWLKRALNLLARREHSELELTKKLIQKLCPEDIAVAVVNTCLQADYLNLTRFAYAYAHNKALSGYGPIRIKLELKAHDISSADISCAFDQIDWDAALLVALRKIKHTEPFKQKKSLYLRGFKQENTTGYI